VPSDEILVSGDGRDRIVWISRLTFIRQLTEHNAPLAAIDINDLTGDIASPCSGTLLHLWSVTRCWPAYTPLVGQIGRSQQQAVDE
jgi:hypothetical protein